MSCYIGIDAGTSGVKTIVINEEGKLLGSGYQECDLITPQPGYAEQYPETWWRALNLSVRQAISMSGKRDEIRGIGFSGQMQGCTLLDKDMRPIRNCILWLDQRSSDEVKDIENILTEDEMFEIANNYCLNSYWAPKLLWIKKNEPDNYDKIYKVLFPKDYLRYRLTGEIATDVSDASLSFFEDVPGRKWSDILLEKIGISNDIVPENLYESSDIAGYLLPSIAEEFDLPAGIPVVAGAGDQQAGAIGSGIVRNGVIGSAIGTSGVIFGCSDKPFIDRQRRAMFSMAHAVPQKWSYLGLVLSAGGSFKWLKNLIFADDKYVIPVGCQNTFEYMDKLAEKAVSGCEGLIFLPYLNGEKTPHDDANARGVFFGLSYRHSIVDICRSVMEGVTFALRDTIEICRELDVDIEEVRATGGGSKSSLWRQIQADIFRTKVISMNLEEGPAAGAAILAAVGAGSFACIEEACDAIVKIEDVTYPIPENVKIYNEYYDTYKSLYSTLKNVYSSHSDIVNKYFD
ncbi:MAG: xylulokinase [Clostridiales Family XIII bacterium]|jgi:xylulokinase|nr:xylulokinase [Clostridiales Family XIII bacterium]